MRVKYQFVGQSYQVHCDLSEKKARKLFEQLKQNGLCEWVELIGEEEDNYMEIIDQYDKTFIARSIAKFMNMF